MLNHKTSFYVLVISFAIVSSCTNSSSYKTADVSKINSDVQVLPFHKEFHQLSTTNFNDLNPKLKSKYGLFYFDFVYEIMGFYKGNKDTTDLITPVVSFTQNEAIKGLYDTVEKYFPNLEFLKKDLDKVNKHLQFYFPNKKLTKAYTIIGEFSYGAMTYDDSTLVIGLDMYLGPQYPFYKSFDIPDYLTRKLKQEYIVPNCVEVIYNLYFGSRLGADATLVESMVEEGKKLYFMECVMPQKPDTLLIGYTQSQLNWCKVSEKQIWKFMNEKDLLYTTNILEQKRYTSDGPTTNGMPADSPGKIGAWVGWQIVRKYMKDNSGKISMMDLLEKVDAKTIISKAKYKP